MNEMGMINDGLLIAGYYSYYGVETESEDEEDEEEDSKVKRETPHESHNSKCPPYGQVCEEHFLIANCLINSIE